MKPLCDWWTIGGPVGLLAGMPMVVLWWAWRTHIMIFFNFSGLEILMVGVPLSCLVLQGCARLCQEWLGVMGCTHLIIQLAHMVNYLTQSRRSVSP